MLRCYFGANHYQSHMVTTSWQADSQALRLQRPSYPLAGPETILRLQRSGGPAKPTIKTSVAL